MTTGGAYPKPVEQLIEQLSRLPGVGRRSAERIAIHVLKQNTDDAMQLARAIEQVKTTVNPCSICHALAHAQPCQICSDPRRNASTILVVEQTRDQINFETTGAYDGVYHVLNGRLDALAGVEPDQLTISDLVARVRKPARNSRQVPVAEVILGLSPDMEGDSTALYIVEQLQPFDVRISRLARGLPSGTQLEFASTAVLSDAIRGRQRIEHGS